MDFEQKMNLALNLYQADKPVVLRGTDGQIIHGAQDATASDCKVIGEIDPTLWNASHWPQLLDGARQQWLKNRKI